SFGFNIFVCIVLISNTPLFLLFLTYFFKVSGQVLFNTSKSDRALLAHHQKLPQTSNASMYRLTPFSW
ncbi:MAG: hypothetical protein O7151_01485, partial [Wolbachia endosymbiont of Andrena bicolor]|nr:hypothetical protein [Wolbachia endosymbiont of Andrena bicolor]